MPTYSDFILNFSNSHLIMERTVKCTVKDYEMNYSYNPSLYNSGSEDTQLSFATGSDFTPYATTIGLYNDSNELLMVAKFGQPIPLSPDTDTNFLIKIDI